MEVQIVSKGCVKPSSPTPHHLKTYKLCLLDQVAPPVYTPVVLFYLSDNPNLSPTDISSRSLLLKWSLSESLTSFYPFSGRLNDHLSVDCNDEGAYYVEAKINSPLSDYLNSPDLMLMHKFLPSEFSWRLNPPGSHLLLIQETNFECGGFSIGLFLSHLIADGTTLSSFLRHWAVNSCKWSDKIVHPRLDAQCLFPQVDAFPLELNPKLRSRFFMTGRLSPRRFVFEGSSIESLKVKASSCSSLVNPTRVGVVLALLSKCIKATFEAKSPGTKKPTIVLQAVNLRRRANPHLPESLVGNICLAATSLLRNDEQDGLDLSGLLCQTRETLSKIDGDFVKSLQGDRGFLKLYETMSSLFNYTEASGGMDYIGFTSWCNFGLYQVDFGWGKPVWASHCVSETTTEVPFVNLVILSDTRAGNGIEALVFLEEGEMTLLEQNKELLEHALIDPSPLKLGAPSLLG